MSSTVEFVSLEIADFRPFGGTQTFVFARPRVAGQSALTVITGDCGSGKSSLIATLMLALWGTRLSLSHSAACRSPVFCSGDPFAKAGNYVNADALHRSHRTARVTLTLSIDGGGAEPATTVINRTWRASTAGTVTESVRVASSAAGQTVQRCGSAAQATISRLLPPRSLVRLFPDCELFENLGRAVLPPPPAGDRVYRYSALRSLVDSVSEPQWRAVAPAVIEFVNEVLSCDSERPCLRLLSEPAGRALVGALQIVPGVWANFLPSCHTHLVCIGTTLALGIALSGDPMAPFVLDAPAFRLPPIEGGLLLEALSESGCPQIVVAAHECQIDDLALGLWHRAQRIYLVENPSEGRCALLSEPVAGR